MLVLADMLKFTASILLRNNTQFNLERYLYTNSKNIITMLLKLFSYFTLLYATHASVPQYDDLVSSESSTEISLGTTVQKTELTVQDIADNRQLITEVETPFFAVGDRKVLTIASISALGCGSIVATKFQSNFDAWPKCSTMSTPLQSNWNSFLLNAFADDSPDPAVGSVVDEDDLNVRRFPAPPTNLEGWGVTRALVSGGNIKYVMTANVGSLNDQCGIAPTFQDNNDKYDVRLATTTFYKDDNNVMHRSCEEQQIDVSLNRKSTAVASFSTEFGLSASIQKVEYETCDYAQCVPSKGPQLPCDTAGEDIYRRMAVTYDIVGADDLLAIEAIHHKDENCYGFGEAGTSIEEHTANSGLTRRVVVRTACINMRKSDNVIDCDAFKTCSDTSKSADDYSFTMDVKRVGGDATGIAMSATLDYTECPSYNALVKEITMAAQLSFYKGGGGDKDAHELTTAVLPALENAAYLPAEELMVAMSLDAGSSSGAHNLRIKKVVACLFVDTPDAATLTGIKTGVWIQAMREAGFENHPAGCTRDSWPAIDLVTYPNPFQTQYLLVDNFDVTTAVEALYTAERCKSTTPSLITAPGGTDTCPTDTCRWSLPEGGHLDSAKKALNTWDAFRISTGPFMRSGNVQWIVDMTGDVEFCDKTNRRRRLLRAVVPIGDEIASRRLAEKHILEPAKADKGVTADTMATVSFSDGKKEFTAEQEKSIHSSLKKSANWSVGAVVVGIALVLVIAIGIMLRHNRDKNETVGAQFAQDPTAVGNITTAVGKGWKRMNLRPMSVDSVVNKNAESRRSLGMGAFRL